MGYAWHALVLVIQMLVNIIDICGSSVVFCFSWTRTMLVMLWPFYIIFVAFAIGLQALANRTLSARIVR